MKGALHCVLEEVVTRRFGDDVWDEVLTRAGADGAYTSLAEYPDSEFDHLVSAIADKLEVDVDAAYVLGGRLAFEPLVRRHVHVMDGLRSWRQVVEHLDDIIHPEVRKLYPGARVPVFRCRPGDDGRMHLVYESERGLCRLAEGLAMGVGDYFSTPVVAVHASCRHDGDVECELILADADAD